MAVRLVDTHCHLNFDSYDPDRAEVLERASAEGVVQVVNPAIDLETGGQILELAARHQGVFAAIGLHPNSSRDFTRALLDDLEAQAVHVSVVAVGEIGLDYYWDKSPRELQIEAFEAQLALAARLEKPVIIHNREASDDVIAVLQHWVRALPPALVERPGVLHSFSAPAAIAESALAAGFYIGFTGPLTYKNADELRRVAAAVPLNRLLVETDGPFLTPVPHRGKRNEPAYIPLIVDRLAAIKGVSFEQMARATTDNAAALFRLPAAP